MSEFDRITNNVLDYGSKNKFWSKVAPNVREATKKAGYDPTAFLVWNSNTGNWYMKEQDLLCWFKIVYPTSIIQTEKAMLEMGKLCQYRVKIYLTPNAEIPNIFEGPVILKDDNNFFANTINYIATARTMAIGNALRHCGFGCQVNDEYFVVDPSTIPQTPPESATSSNNQSNTKQQSKTNNFAEITIDEAANCPISYLENVSRRKMYNGRKLGEVAELAPTFIKRIIEEDNFCDDYTRACAKVLVDAATN